MKPQICQVCGDDVVFGQLLPTGAVCVDCGDVATDVLPGPLAAVDALEPVPRADPRIPDCGIHGCVRVKGHLGFHTTTVELAKSEDKVALERLIANELVVSLVAEACEFKVADLRPFDAVRTSRSEQLSVEVEEWVCGYDGGGIPTLVRTPREIFPARIAENVECFAGLETCRFVVVLEHRMPDSDVTLRDIGPSFTPRPGSRDDRAAALNTAAGWARSQAARLRADPPRGFRPARDIS